MDLHLYGGTRIMDDDDQFIIIPEDAGQQAVLKKHITRVVNDSHGVLLVLRGDEYLIEPSEEPENPLEEKEIAWQWVRKRSMQPK